MKQTPAPILPAKGCLIARADYGYPGLTTSDGWPEADAGKMPVAAIVQAAAGAPAGLLLRHAEWALAWAATREGHDLFPHLARLARRKGLAVECRFPRHGRDLRLRLEGEGLKPVLWETPADGGVPPLYEGLADRPELLRLHLEYEWATALGAARGGAALLRTALLLARGGPAPAALLAEKLGLTAGACRAYLSWMEDVALVRRDGRDFALRHPLLASLFAPAASAKGAPAPRVRPRRREPKPEPAAPSPQRQLSVDWD